MDRRSRKARRLTALLPAVLTASLLATGCSGGDADSKSDGAREGGAAGKAAGTPRIKIAMVTHAAPDDTFWDLVRRGAEVAAAKDNAELLYSSDPSGAKQARLVQEAIDRKVDGIAVTLAKPEAMKSAIAKARAARIPVVGLNSGIEAWKSQDVLEYFGQDESVTGQSLGRRLNSLGAEHTLCVIHERGNVALEARCAGVKKTFKNTTENLYVNGGNMGSVRSAITDRLQEDPSIDEVVTLGAPFALTAVGSVSDAGAKAKVATFDLNKELVQAVKAGKVQLAVDQQPYLQGYLAVDALWLYKANGNYSGGGAAPVLTGPAFVSKDNVDDVAKFAAKGTR
ncbi:substrate-binding domain-containing protein [Wenjunlia tyrosinilytica]|uniref:Sugar ABC transporter substrate-binding protein n=1 Tax=Wenjunlia tyrosinilytica TaxID=1544741 RepID=A0A917ZUX8_9ACTN|nr:substrate-binding domain-containing protein [Wenjunlia tyrosinilytica]GGO96554.1 sugar ABC transporter substrate-binding protein [Wenjunlia tyrosinilytica]